LTNYFVKLGAGRDECKHEAAKQEGKQEDRQEIALKMLKENIPLETIARITEFSIERLEQLRSENADR
jgi:predicted transposase/invertase (TIGR01784 family)